MAQPRLAVPPQLRSPAEVGAAPPLSLRGVCAREQGAGWAARGGGGGKQVAPMLQLAAVSSATLGPQPLGLQPPRKQELCAAPERPDAVPAIGEVGEAEPEKARAREGSCCGFLRTSGRPVPLPAVPAAGHRQQQTSPPAPQAGRSASDRVLVSLCPSPAPCPAARLTSAKPPAREREGLGRGTKRPSPQPLGTHAAAAASRLLPSDSPGRANGLPPDPKAPGKRLQQPCRGTAPCSA